MKLCIALLLVIFALGMAGCQSSTPVCPTGSVTHQKSTTPFPTQPSSIDSPVSSEQVLINGKAMDFDQVVHGQLCNLILSGNVYIACDVMVAEWSGAPNFLDGCDFVVEPGTVIYVAAHNNAPYYKGCVSCHQSKGDNTP